MFAKLFKSDCDLKYAKKNSYCGWPGGSINCEYGSVGGLGIRVIVGGDLW